MSAAEPTSSASDAASLLVSIVIPTHDRRDSLRRTLLSLAQQTLPAGDFEAIVVCDGCSDGSGAMCRELAAELPYRLRVIEQSNAGPAGARNRGVDAAQAPLIVFLDDDIAPAPALLATHLRAHDDNPDLVTIGPMLPPEDQRLSVWGEWENAIVLREYRAMEAGAYHATERQFFTGNAAMTHRHFVAAGGFNPAFRRAEDVELALRLGALGLTFDFLPEAWSWHYISRSFASWLRTPTQYGEADVLMARAGHLDALGLVAVEFPRRSPPVRALVWLCAGRGWPMRLADQALQKTILWADRGRRRRVARVACSLIFNLRYYDRIAQMLGGPGAFHAFLRGRDTKAALAAAPASA